MKLIYGFIIWFIITLFVVYSFCLSTAAAVFSQAIKVSLNLTDLSASMATSAFILGFAIMQIPAGYLLDKYNARYVVSVGVFLLALGNLLISLSSSLVWFSLANFLQGLGAAFAFVAAAILISQWFSAQAFPILFGLTQAIACILAGIIHYVFTQALETYTWNSLYGILSLVGFILLILSLLIVKTPPNYQRDNIISLKESLFSILRNRQIILCSLAAATSFGILLAYASFWYMKVQSYYSVGNLEAVFISGMIFLGIGIGTPFIGWISNLVKSRKLILHLSLVLGTMALILVIYLPHYNINTLIIIKIVSFLTGFLLSGSMLFYTMINEIASDNIRGVAISFIDTCVFLFNTFMLFIPYLFLTSISKEFFTYLWLLPFFVLFSILLLYFIKETYIDD
ncbi:MFS transporter [Legionella sp. D16C41]|uniref:MFS transporter n=1 Tax=Legionella sp. D16C41 TaxID=3402688 RepID=UPI003AF60660